MYIACYLWSWETHTHTIHKRAHVHTFPFSERNNGNKKMNEEYHLWEEGGNMWVGPRMKARSLECTLFYNFDFGIIDTFYTTKTQN